MDDPDDYVRNRILRELASRDLQVLLPRMETVALGLRTTLHEADQPIHHVYFIETGTVSMIATLEDGSQSEVGLVGREGMVGLPVVLGSSTAVQEALVQIEGSARRMAIGPFQQAIATIPNLREALLGYTNAFHFQVSQTAACNSRHLIDQRLARWILMTADRVEDDQFVMTQEFISKMLAVGRPGVNLAMSRLQRGGLVQHKRGWLRVTDRPGLEAASCNCYGAVRERFPVLGG